MPSATRHTFGSIEQAAEILNCNPRTVRRMIARGEIVAYRVGPRLVRVDLDELTQAFSRIPAAVGGAA